MIMEPNAIRYMDPMNFKCSIYFWDKLVGRLEVDNGNIIKNECYTNVLGEHPFPKTKNLRDILYIFANRVFPPVRCTPQLLEMMGLEEYNVYNIFRLNHGTSLKDHYWFKFDDDDTSLCWYDVNPRNPKWLRELNEKAPTGER